MAASAGYFLLCIGDKVYVDNSSLIGSIGVIINRLNISNILKSNKIDSLNVTTN